MDEFKTQFEPGLLIGGSSKSKDKYGNKYYNPAIVRRRMIVKTSLRSFKTATDAQEWARAIVTRYKRLVMAALLAYAEAEEIEDAKSTN